jgi:hypothetical protein
MNEKRLQWKKGLGELGALDPILGSWIAESDSPMGGVKCTRIFKSILDGKYVELNARWDFTKYVYEELSIYGIKDGNLSFWSFTSDGKRSEGEIADGSDVHPDAICFEAQMPAGLARMIYWPHEDGGFNWAAESKEKSDWNRFAEHHCHPLK